jgi:glycosyltransferase involved in cell wall biosynthesis
MKKKKSILLVGNHLSSSGQNLGVGEDTCINAPYHILFAGRISKGKGILEVISAVSKLVLMNEDLVLDLVGIHDDSAPIEVIFSFAKELGIEDRIIYHGYKPVGSQLFRFYKQADLFVIASKSTEGFPRTIWEAMAHGLPVIATAVGGIPGFIENCAEIILPCSVHDLVHSIHRLLHDQNLRKKYINAGYELARQNTLPKQTDKLVKIIEEWINE